MEVDNKEVAELEQQNKFINGSAAAGASAVRAAEDRALAAELAKIDNKCVMMILWGLAKFFDSIDMPTLFREAWRLGFPLQKLAMSMSVHHAPRMMKLGSASGSFIARSPDGGSLVRRGDKDRTCPFCHRLQTSGRVP